MLGIKWLVLLSATVISVISGHRLFGCTFDEEEPCYLADDVVDRTGASQIKWTIRNGSSPSLGTGPSSDQSGMGNYAFFETSFPTRKGQQARLYTSEWLIYKNGTFEGEVCISFYYHMYGVTMGSLELYKRSGTPTATTQTLWQRDTQAGNMWMEAKVKATLDTGTDIIGWKATKGSGFQGDIGLDTISVSTHPEKCDVEPPPAAGIQIMLENGMVSTDYSFGQLMVNSSGTMGSVCDDYFDKNDAKVFCTMMGYTGEAYFLGNQFGASKGVIWLDDLRCVGTETHVNQCPGVQWGSHNCKHEEDVSIACFKETGSTMDIAVRLVGGRSDGPGKAKGRLEVRYRGVWGTVCDDGFTDNEAKVSCRMMGYQGAASVYNPAEVNYKSGVMWLDDVRCEGSEPSLDECQHAGWGVTNCDQEEQVYIECYQKVCEEGEFQCKDLSCVDSDAVCNGQVDCPDGSDEGNHC